MKKIIKLVLVCVLVFAFSCKSREKQVQKSETQTETKSEATYKIEDKTFEIVSKKELLKFDKSTIDKSEETKKDETKNIEVIREYYENGNLKSEYQKSFSQLSEATKYAIAEMREKLSKEKETSQYWEDSSNHFYKAFEQEKNKTKDYEMKLKAKETFTWKMFFVGVVLGAIIVKPLLRWLWNLINQLQPWLKITEWVKNLKFKK